MPSLYWPCLRQTLRENERMAAGTLRDEARPADLEPDFLEPGDVGGPIGMTPVHRRTEPIVFGSGPGSKSHGGEQISARPEPAVDLPEDRRLLLDRHMDDRKEGHDGRKALWRENDGCHICALN